MSPEPHRERKVGQKETGSSSESEADDDVLVPDNGYQPLQQDVSDSDVDVDAAVDSVLSSFPHPASSEVPQLSAEAKLLHQTWQESSEFSSDRLQISPENVSVIMEKMQKFQLPNQNIPAWANDVSEQVWKQRLQSTLQSSQSRFKPDLPNDLSSRSTGSQPPVNKDETINISSDATQCL